VSISANQKRKNIAAQDDYLTCLKLSRLLANKTKIKKSHPVILYTEKGRAPVPRMKENEATSGRI
jgi:hypothetical protein